jgi:hypothetical protein
MRKTVLIRAAALMEVVPLARRAVVGLILFFSFVGHSHHKQGMASASHTSEK